MKTKSAKEYLEHRLKNKSFAKAYDEVEFLVKMGVMIAKAREEAGLAESELAKLLKTTQSVISRIENGNQNLSLTMLADITHMLKCSLLVRMNDDQVAI